MDTIYKITNKKQIISKLILHSNIKHAIIG